MPAAAPIAVSRDGAGAPTTRSPANGTRLRPAAALRGALRGLAWRSGALARQHRRANRESLTVLMFHRVLPAGTAGLRDADPIYTVSDTFFADCLAFLRRHYTVVDLATVAAAAAGAALPPRALLITFDDGWRCNLTVARPLLRAAGMPAVVFLAADALHDPAPGWWQETLLAALRARRMDAAALWRLAGPDPAPGPPDALALLRRFAALPSSERLAVLASLEAGRPAPHTSGYDDVRRDMLRPEDIVALAPEIATGSHSAQHLPLSQLPPGEAAADLVRAAAVLGHPPALSIPHGRYDANVLAAAKAAGHVLIFTSDAVINPAPGGRLASAVLGRISVQQDMVSDAAGRLDPARLATWLFRREVRGAA